MEEEKGRGNTHGVLVSVVTVVVVVVKVYSGPANVLGND